MCLRASSCAHMSPAEPGPEGALSRQPWSQECSPECWDCVWLRAGAPSCPLLQNILALRRSVSHWHDWEQLPSCSYNWSLEKKSSQFPFLSLAEIKINTEPVRETRVSLGPLLALWTHGQALSHTCHLLWHSPGTPLGQGEPCQGSGHLWPPSVFPR